MTAVLKIVDDIPIVRMPLQRRGATVKISSDGALNMSRVERGSTPADSLLEAAEHKQLPNVKDEKVEIQEVATTEVHSAKSSCGRKRDLDEVESSDSRTLFDDDVSFSASSRRKLSHSAEKAGFDRTVLLMALYSATKSSYLKTKMKDSCSLCRRRFLTENEREEALSQYTSDVKACIQALVLNKKQAELQKNERVLKAYSRNTTLSSVDLRKGSVTVLRTLKEQSLTQSRCACCHRGFDKLSMTSSSTCNPNAPITNANATTIAAFLSNVDREISRRRISHRSSSI